MSETQRARWDHQDHNAGKQPVVRPPRHLPAAFKKDVAGEVFAIVVRLNLTLRPCSYLSRSAALGEEFALFHQEPLGLGLCGGFKRLPFYGPNPWVFPSPQLSLAFLEMSCIPSWKTHINTVCRTGVTVKNKPDIFDWRHTYSLHFVYAHKYTHTHTWFLHGSTAWLLKSIADWLAFTGMEHQQKWWLGLWMALALQ